MKHKTFKAKIVRTIIFTILSISLLLNCVSAQNQILISGTISDAKTKAPLPFANIFLMKQLIGTVSNEEGKFELNIPIESYKIHDTLLFSYLGYKHQLIDINKVKDTLKIAMEAASLNLQEVVVKPLSPTYYIKMAMNKVKENYPVKPFQTEAYYREIVKENKNFVKSDEGIFKTFYPDYQDTVRNQHQLLLYRKADNLQEVEFMKKEVKKMEKKEDRKNKKENKDEKSEIDILKMAFGGPEEIIKLAKINTESNNFLDSNKFKHFNYTFGKSSSYNEQELIIINFSSKGKVDYERIEGSIYIDNASYAIIKIETYEEPEIPMLLRPVLLVAGFEIQNIKANTKLEYQLINERWYPKKININFEADLTRIHYFSHNEQSNFEGEQIFIVNKTKKEDVFPIDTTKRYDYLKKMDKQVFNDAGISWNEVNIVKK